MPDLHYFRPDWIERSDRSLVADVVVYGGTAAGVVAAIEVVRRGKSVVVLNPGKHVGGLTTGGLGFTDFGKQHVVGGRARELYRAMGKKCGREELWLFAPSEAQAVLAEWMREHGIEVINRQYLERVERQGDRISAVVMMGGLRAMGKVFVDASYEGDLLARAGVSYTVGREGREVYGEQLAGIQVLAKHQFVPARVSAYVREGDASSGLLPGIESEDLTKQQGRGDKRVQAYNFRICMTDDPALKIDWEKPEKYDPMLYVLAERWFNGEKDVYNEQLTDTLPAAKKFDILENKTAGGFFKTDTNNQGPVSSDFIGANHEWPEACFERREELFQAHVNYQKGFYWMMANNPAIPERYRAAYRRWGLSRDEFVATGGWSPQLYVREARRLIGEYVVTEADCMGTRKCEDPVGMGSYALDSHNCCRFVNAEGMVMNEGDVQVPPPGPYGVSYRAMVPKAGECANLLVPVCVSTSHIAYGSVRMEPVFMILGQSAAVAACMAIDGGLPVQAVSYAKLRDELLKSGQVLVVA